MIVLRGPRRRRGVGEVSPALPALNHRLSTIATAGALSVLASLRRGTTVDVDMAAAGFLEDAGCGQFPVGILTADPQQRRTGLQCRIKIVSVARCGIVVEQFL